MAYASSWQNNVSLKHAMEQHVFSNIQRNEMLDFLKRDFPEYSWSMRTLDRRLRHFNLYYTDYTISVDEVKDAVAKEIQGPGALLGYRAMHQKIRQKYALKVPRDLVHDVMYNLNSEQLEKRRPGNKNKRKGHFVSKGPNWVWSLDGHDKLMGFQNSTFPLAIYGCIDTASRKILWLKVWDTNSKPELIGRWYFEYLFETKRISNYIRVDRGTETGVMATMQAFLRSKHNDLLDDPTDSVIYGPSTSNQIERWWRELHERLENYFKEGLVWLKDERHYDPNDDRDRSCLKYIMIPIIQRELEDFKNIVWNTHRIRKQKGIYLPDGIPNHIHAFPENYEMENCGFDITEEELRTVAELSGILKVSSDYLEPETRRHFETIVEDVNEISSKDYVEKYLLLKYS